MLMIFVFNLVVSALAGSLRGPAVSNVTLLAREPPAIVKALLGFELLPSGTEKDPFIANCSAALSKKLPEMTQAYTARLVPSAIMHQCGIYRTKVHYQSKGGSIERAEYDCEAFGKMLIKAFEGDKNYKPWCDEVYVYLTTGDYTKDKKEQERLLKEQEKIRAELRELRKLYNKEYNKTSNETDFECPLPCHPNPRKHRPLTGEALNLEDELKSLQKDLGMAHSMEDDLDHLAKLDGDFSDKDADLLDSTLNELDGKVEKHDSDEDNVKQLEMEIRGLRDDITSSKHEFPKGLEEELREAKLLRYDQEVKFDDQSVDKLNKELGGMEKELGTNFSNMSVTLPHEKIPDEINCTDGTDLKQPAVVAFSAAPCCPSTCQICAHSSAFLMRTRQAKTTSNIGFQGVDLFHSLVRDFAQHPTSPAFQASCLKLASSTFETRSISLAELQRECELYAGGDVDDDDDDSIKAHCIRFAKELQIDHRDARKQKSWCQRVHGYLEGRTRTQGELPTIYHPKHHAGVCCPKGCRTCAH